MLDFFAGGSINESSFEVKINGAQISFRETARGGMKEVQKKTRPLLPAELEDIQKTIAGAQLLTQSSQDFVKNPLVPDQGSYRIHMLLDGKTNSILCGIPSSENEPGPPCQKQIDKLRLKLNKILGVRIY